ncbi:hypothetical protein, partial [Pseudomonas gingeri]
RRAHNPKVVGSNPAPATKYQKRLLERVAFFVSAEKVVQHRAPMQNEPSTQTGVNACTGYAEFATNFLYNSPGAWVAARR